MDSLHEATATFHSTDGDELADYRSVCLLSFFGLLLGLASPLALVRLVLIAIPLAAVFTSILALKRIRASDGRLFGRWAALGGLYLAVFFAVAAPTYSTVRRQLMVGHARPLAEEFLSRLTRGEPHKAVQLTKLPSSREPIDVHLWEHYRSSDDARQSISQFVGHPMIGTLLALGEEAEVRYFGCGGVQRSSSISEQVVLFYAVTYEMEGRKRSFFVEIMITRLTGGKNAPARWRIASFQGGIRPETAS